MTEFTYKELFLINEIAASMQIACFNDGRESMLDRANEWQSIADKCKHNHAQSGDNWLSDKCTQCGLDLRNEIHARIR